MDGGGSSSSSGISLVSSIPGWGWEGASGGGPSIRKSGCERPGTGSPASCVWSSLPSPGGDSPFCNILIGALGRSLVGGLYSSSSSLEVSWRSRLLVSSLKGAIHSGQRTLPLRQAACHPARHLSWNTWLHEFVCASSSCGFDLFETDAACQIMSCTFFNGACWVIGWCRWVLQEKAPLGSRSACVFKGAVCIWP